MGKFYLDKRYYAARRAKWVSFETTPGLDETKRDIYGTCVPCITNLYEQLQSGQSSIDLGRAYTCWKVVAVLKDDQECVQILTEFEKEFLGERMVKGRFGSGDSEKQTRVMVFSAADEKERDLLVGQVSACAKRVNPGAQISFHRGCAELYHDLFGDWKTWMPIEKLKKPEAVKDIIARIRKMLYWDPEGG